MGNDGYLGIRNLCIKRDERIAIKEKKSRKERLLTKYEHLDSTRLSLLVLQ